MLHSPLRRTWVILGLIHLLEHRPVRQPGRWRALWLQHQPGCPRVHQPGCQGLGLQRASGGGHEQSPCRASQSIRTRLYPATRLPHWLRGMAQGVLQPDRCNFVLESRDSRILSHDSRILSRDSRVSGGLEVVMPLLPINRCWCVIICIRLSRGRHLDACLSATLLKHGRW